MVRDERLTVAIPRDQERIDAVLTKSQETEIAET